jgi:hypothetical protein
MHATTDRLSELVERTVKLPEKVYNARDIDGKKTVRHDRWKRRLEQQSRSLRHKQVF